jgi:hypothetical protein
MRESKKWRDRVSVSSGNIKPVIVIVVLASARTAGAWLALNMPVFTFSAIRVVIKVRQSGARDCGKVACTWRSFAGCPKLNWALAGKLDEAKASKAVNAETQIFLTVTAAR